MAVIDPQRELAARVAARAELHDIRLFSDKSELKNLPSAGSLSYDLNIEANSEWDEGDSFFAVRCNYSVVLKQMDDESKVDDEHIDSSTGDAESLLASLEFTFRGLFQLELREGDLPPTTDELKAYAITTGSFALYPYAREYVRDVTSRMGLPTLNLGVLRQPIKLDNEPDKNEA